MKIIVLILIIYFFAVLAYFACNPPQPKPYRFGEYKLLQTYTNNTITGSIYFYSENEFYTNLAGIKNNYVYSLTNGKIIAECTGCNASYNFTTSKTDTSEIWVAYISGSKLIWEIMK